jgi:radical SAM superfamily enzyme YgiQ (UPF0313 family)
MDMFRDHPTPPLNLLSAASVICAEMEIRLVDQRTGDWRAELAKVLDAGTVAIGVTALTGSMITNALDALREARRHSKAPIVWGGVHASLLPEQTVSHELADFVVEGEGEFALAELCRRLASGADTAGIPGVWRKAGGKIDHTPRAPLLDLDSLPPVPFHLADMERYIQLFDGGKRALFLQSSRGCPFPCAYCYNTVYNKGAWRGASAKKVLSEIAAQKDRLRLDAVFIWDDNFFIDPQRARDIVRGVRDMGLRCLLHGADVESLARMTDADLDFLEEMGVEALAIGIESATDRVRRDVLKKPGSIAHVRGQLHRFKGRKIDLSCFFILGFPTETRAEMRATVEFAMEVMSMGPNFHVERIYNFTPYPGTGLYDVVKAGGMSFPGKLEDWGTHHWDYSHMFEHDPELKDYIERVYKVSKFLDTIKDPFVDLPWYAKAVFLAYHPVAWLRLKYDWFSFMPELSWGRARGSHFFGDGGSGF